MNELQQLLAHFGMWSFLADQERVSGEGLFITEKDKQVQGTRAIEMVSHSTVNCTVSQQYSYQHEVLLCALWSVLATGGRERWAQSGGRATHTGCCCGYKSTLNGCEGVGCVSSTCDGGRRETNAK